MRSILITKSGKIIRENHFDKNDKKEALDTLVYNLSSPLELEEGVTFKTFFNFIMQDKDFFDIVFFEEMGGYSLDLYEDEWKKRAIKPKYSELGEIKNLEISKMKQVAEFENQNIFETLTLFQGVGIDEIGDYIEYTLSLTPLNELKNYQLILNNNIEIYTDSVEDLGLEPKPILEALTQITVYEAIQSILYEITFYGSPEEKEKTKQEIIKNHSVENMIPFLESRIEDAVEIEDYNTAAKLKKLIDKMKKGNNSNKKN